jgi:hypothetical protein
MFENAVRISPQPQSSSYRFATSSAEFFFSNYRSSHAQEKRGFGLAGGFAAGAVAPTARVGLLQEQRVLQWIGTQRFEFEIAPQPPGCATFVEMFGVPPLSFRSTGCAGLCP